MSGRTPGFALADWHGRKLLFVIAALPEYGPHLRALIQPLICGVGPVEAAVTTTAALAWLKARGALPDLVVSLGSAGSRTLEQAALYQVSSVAYRDMDATALGFAKNATPFLGLPAVMPLSCLLFEIPTASLATGASVVSGAAYHGIEADMVDMETYAVLRACQTAGVPLIGLRVVSDGAAELRHLSDWTEVLPVVDSKLARAVEQLRDTDWRPPPP